MKNFRRVSLLLCAIVFCFSLVSVPASAASASIGSAFHTYTNVEPAHFYLTASVQYSELYDDQMTITSMSQTVINYNDSGTALQCPYFLVVTGSRYNNTYGYYNSTTIDIPDSYSNTAYTYCNWEQFMESYYPRESTTYTIPTDTNDNSNGLYTEIGIWTGSYYDTMSLAYQHMGYWFGDGTLIKRDYVSNDGPIVTTTTVATVSTQSMPLISSEKGNTSVLSMDIAPNSEIVGMATLPVIATDSTFEDLLDINQSNVVLNQNGTVSIGTPITEDTLYIKTPVLLERITTNNGANLNPLAFDVCIIEDEDLDIMVCTYNEDQLGTFPETVSLNISGQYIENLFAQIFYDTQGNETGGRLIFAIPPDFDLSAEYSFELISEIVHTEQQTIIETT